MQIPCKFLKGYPHILEKKDREELMNRYNEIIKNNDIIFDNYYNKKTKKLGIII